MSASKKSKSPIICCGVAGIIFVACLTGFSVNAVINKVNDNADKAYAEAVTNVQNAQMAEWRAEQDRLAQLEKESSNKPVAVTDYTVDDIIMIDGEWYIISSLIPSPSDSSDSDSNSISGNKPIIVNPSDTVDVDGNSYSHIDNPENIPTESPSNDTQDSVDVEGVDEQPYIGADYVTIDIDGNMVYLVQKGDTLTKISNLTGYSVQELAEYNCIENVNLIYTNQSIRIPAGQDAIDYVLHKQNSNEDPESVVQSNDAVIENE